MTDPARDRSLDGLLKRTLDERAAAGPCPDAETLAAWMDGTLGQEGAQLVEPHLADCGRCRSHVAAMVRMQPGAGVPASRILRARTWPWLVPLTGAAAAAGLWFLVQPPPKQPEPRADEAVVRREPAEQDTLAAQPARPSPPAGVPADRPESKVARRQEAVSRDRGDERPEENRALEASRESAAPAAAAPEAAPAPALASGARDQARVAASAQATIDSLAVRRADDGQVTWETASAGIAADLRAGASPSPTVIWLVGKQGLVLLTTDGRAWRRLAFPEPVDLIGVEASSDREATVTTADARRFTTSDGGSTWRRP